MRPSRGRDAFYVLDAETAHAYAADRGLAVVAGSSTVLSGGVSSTAVALDGLPPIVLKQALSHLRVPGTWTANPARSAIEAEALTVFSAITPDNVPAVLDVDLETHIIAITRAPDGWRDWRASLFDGADPTDVDRAREAGGVLGRWHSQTWGDESLRARFAHPGVFEQLRIDPFYREVARRGAVDPRVIEPLIDELTSAGACLVHGDFSPKNILVGDSGLWVIDAEVAHFGAPVFDLAFLMAHLALKTIHLEGSADMLAAAASSFVEAYEAANPGKVASDRLAAHAAAIMLARVDGKSPAAYLSDDEATRTRGIALDVLNDAQPSLDALWHAVRAPSRSGGVS